MLKNAPTLAIVAVHTEENEPFKNFEMILFIISIVPLLPMPGAARVWDPHWDLETFGGLFSAVSTPVAVNKDSLESV